MTDDLTEFFFRAHDGLPRQAPGSDDTTRLLLRLAGPLPPNPRILDIGSGPGSSSILLAQLTNGHVTAVDTHEPFLVEARARAARAGIAERVTTLNAPMDELPVPDGSIDLVWAEGSAYIMGFDAALTAWRRLLSDDGVLVATEAEWLTDAPAAQAHTFWSAGYPAMRTTGGNVSAAQRAGYDVRALYVLPDSDWAEYYDPLAANIATMRTDGVPPEILTAIGEEIDIRTAHGRDYAYTGYVLRTHVASGV